MVATPAHIARVKTEQARKSAPGKGMAAHIKARCAQGANCTGPGCKVRR